MFVCFVLSGRGLCDGLITRPEESYRLWCVVCDLETSWMRRTWPSFGPQRHEYIYIYLLFLLLLIKCYNLYNVLACSTTLFHLSLLCATFFQLLMFMLFISSKTSSSQRVLGLPVGLLDMGFHLLIFCTILSSVMRSTWPNHFNLCFLINPIIFCPFNI